MTAAAWPLRDAFAAAAPAALAELDAGVAAYLHAVPPSPHAHRNRATARIFDNLGPVFPCPPSMHEQFGTGDAGKHTCGLAALATGRSEADGCVVLSIGSNNQWEFEEAVHAHTNCRLIVADCTCDETCVGL